MDIKELLDAIRLTCPDCGWSWLRTALMGRQHIRCPDCGLMFATFIDPTAKRARAFRYIAAAHQRQSINRIFGFSYTPPRWRKFRRWSFGLGETLKRGERGMTPEQIENHQLDAYLWRVGVFGTPEWLSA